MASSKLNKNTIFDVSPSKVVHTDFLDEHSEQVEQTLGPNQSLLDPLAYQSIVDLKNPSIPLMYRKPFLVAQNVWSTTSAVAAVLYAQSINAIMQSNLSPSHTLLSMFSFFRSGFKFTLRINTSPFHSGKLALMYTPPNRTIPAGVVQVSGYPVAYADAGNSSVVTLEVPFISIQDFLNTSAATTSQACGNISIYNFNPLRIGTGGPTTVGFTLWLEPVDPELAIPVRQHAVTLQSEDMPLTMPDVSLPGLGPISEVTEILDRLGGLRPLLEQPLSSSPQVSPKIASPLKSNATVKETSYAGSAPSIANMNGHKTDHLSLVPEETKVDQSFEKMLGRPEQSLIEIAQIPQLLCQYQWATADAFNTNLGVFPVLPTLSNYVAPTAGVAGYRDLPFCSYVSHPFTYWRGSMNFRFVFASTQQHSGRVQATWIPGDSLVNGDSQILPASSLGDLSLYPSVVFDLSENREFNVSIPYSNVTPFKATLNTRITPPASTNVSTLYCNGVLYLRVLNPLRGPTTVSSTIDFNTFISMGSDFQIKGLNSARLGTIGIPYISDTPAVQLQSLDVALEASRQGMEEDKNNPLSLKVHKVPKDTDQGYNSDNYLPKLLSRYYPQAGFRFTLAAESNRVFRLAQHPGLLVQPDSQVVDARTLVFSNLISYYSKLFTFWEGSLNYFLLHNTTVNNPVLATFTHNNALSPAYTELTPTTYPNQDLRALAQVGGAFSDDTVDLSVATRYSHISNLRLNASVEITLPYRSIYRRSLITRTSNINLAYVPGTLDILYSNPSTTAQQISVQIFQSLGEDFRFQYLVPIERLYLPAGA